MKAIYSIILLFSLFLFLVFSPVFAAKQNVGLSDLETRLLIFQGQADQVNQAKNNFEFSGNNLVYGGASHSLSKEVIINIPAAAPLKVGKTKYFGKVGFQKKADKVVVINYLPLEIYIMGVLQGEISSSWPNAAIKAQAIAARSYAVYLMKQNKNKSYDVVNSEKNQVFRSLDQVHPNIEKNVIETKGVVMTYKNEPIQTFFHATCGGMTEKAEDVWPSDKKFAYFKNIRCHYCTTHPKYSWNYKISSEELQEKLKKSLKITSIKSLKIIEYTPSGRIKKVKVVSGDNKEYFFSGNQLRAYLNPSKLLSTKFKFKKRNGEYYFAGKGFGHGVGLCQWGAKTMAERGFGYKKILNFYYKNIKIKSINRKILLALK